MMIAIYIFTALAVYHFIYQGIVLPSLRFKFRFELFKLRDQLRGLKASCHENVLQPEVYELLQDKINNSLKLLPILDLTVVRNAVKQLEHNDILREKVTRSTLLLDKCALGEIQEIRKESTEIVTKAIMANHGGWLAYVVPFATIGFFFDGIKLLLTFILLPERDIDKVVPPTSTQVI